MWYLIASCLVQYNVIVRPSLPVVPSLTSDNLLPLLKGVKSWWKLAKKLIGAYDKEDHFHYLGGEDLDDLQHQYGSDEECLKAVIEKFLQGQGARYKQPSWRAVLLSLCNANEIQLTSSIKSYAEPLQGVCIKINIDMLCGIG